MRRHGWAEWSYGPWGPWAAFGAGPRSRFFEFGEMRLAILSLLDDGPKHGYQLMKEMQDRSGGLYRASAGSIYPTLQQLEDEGLIESEREEGRRVYRLTAAGKQELEKDPEAVRRIWQRAERWEDWGQWMGPEAMMFAGPMGNLVKSMLRAARWANGFHDRQEELHNKIRDFCRSLDDLSHRA